MYIFNQGGDKCFPFVNDSLHIARSGIYIGNNLIAVYGTDDDCKKVMEYFKKRLALNCREFQFPTQKELNNMNKE